MLKSVFYSVLLTVTLLTATLVQAKNYSDPYLMVSEVASNTFDRIKSERKSIDANPEILRQIMEDELLPHIDYKFSALKVLGKHFKSVPREKIPEFIQVFREYLVTTYALAMAQYDNQTVEFEPAQDFKGEKTVTVRALVKEPGRPDIKLAFKVRLNKKTDEWRAYDMIAEGISMLSSKQSELESVLRQEGIDRVIAILKEKNGQAITLNNQPADS